MKARTRYTLIAIFFAVFFMAAPFVVLFVTGTRYDFQNHRFVKTGTISATTSPHGAQLWINGAQADTTPSTRRFINEGDYQIKITKPGYFDWNKRLHVAAQYVTSVSSGGLNTLYMFKNGAAQTQLSDGVINFSAGQNHILYLTSDALYLADSGSPQRNRTLALPKTFSNLNIVASPDENYYLLYNQDYYAVFSVSDNKLTDITALMKGNTSGAAGTPAVTDDFQFSDNNNLYDLRTGTVTQISWRDGRTTDVVGGAKAFAVRGNNVYVIESHEAGAIPTPGTAALPEPIGSQLVVLQGPSAAATVLLGNLPSWQAAQIFVTRQNQIFVLGDGTLYAVQDALKQIGDFVKDVRLYDSSSTLLFTNGNEVDIYNEFNGEITTATRSSKPISGAIALPTLGWVFYINDDRVQNIEMDNRDHQNNYTFESVNEGAKFFVTQDGQNLFVLNAGKLVYMQIR